MNGLDHQNGVHNARTAPLQSKTRPSQIVNIEDMHCAEYYHDMVVSIIQFHIKVRKASKSDCLENHKPHSFLQCLEGYIGPE